MYIDGHTPNVSSISLHMSKHVLSTELGWKVVGVEESCR